MPCPTCDHTMQSVGKLENGLVLLFWCPRCGTIRRAATKAVEHVYRTDDDVPKLPGRVRKLLEKVSGRDSIDGTDLLDIAWRLGVQESCGTARAVVEAKLVQIHDTTGERDFIAQGEFSSVDQCRTWALSYAAQYPGRKLEIVEQGSPHFFVTHADQ